MMGYNTMSGMMQSSVWGGFGLLSLVALFLVLWAVVDILRTKKMEAGLRIGWLAIVLLGWFMPLSVLGAAAYAIWGRK